MVTPVRMQDSGDLNRQMEYTANKEKGILDKLNQTSNTNTAEDDRDEDKEDVSCKISGLECEPPSEETV